jgi:hypothetical protein
MRRDYPKCHDSAGEHPCDSPNGFGQQYRTGAPKPRLEHFHLSSLASGPAASLKESESGRRRRAGSAVRSRIRWLGRGPCNPEKRENYPLSFDVKTDRAVPVIESAGGAHEREYPILRSERIGRFCLGADHRVWLIDDSHLLLAKAVDNFGEALLLISDFGSREGRQITHGGSGSGTGTDPCIGIEGDALNIAYRDRLYVISGQEPDRRRRSAQVGAGYHTSVFERQGIAQSQTRNQEHGPAKHDHDPA